MTASVSSAASESFALGFDLRYARMCSWCSGRVANCQSARDLAKHQPAAALVELLRKLLDRDLHPAPVLAEYVCERLDLISAPPRRR